MLAIIDIYKKWQYYIKVAIYQVVFIIDYTNLQKFHIYKQLNRKEN